MGDEEPPIGPIPLGGSSEGPWSQVSVFPMGCVRMAQVIEVPELESWFLVHWPDSEHPAILMEFETQEEAEDALSVAFADMTVELGGDTAPVPITVFPALTLLEDPTLRLALASWDAQLEELDEIVQRTMGA